MLKHNLAKGRKHILNLTGDLIEYMVTLGLGFTIFIAMEEFLELTSNGS